MDRFELLEKICEELTFLLEENVLLREEVEKLRAYREKTTKNQSEELAKAWKNTGEILSLLINKNK